MSGFFLLQDLNLTDLTIFSSSSVSRKKYLYIKDNIIIKIIGKRRVSKVSNMVLNFVVETNSKSVIILKKDLKRNKMDISMPFSSRNSVFIIITGTIRGRINKDLFMRKSRGTLDKKIIENSKPKNMGLAQINISIGKINNVGIKKNDRIILISGFVL